MKVKIVARVCEPGAISVPSRELVGSGDGVLYFLVQDTDKEESAVCHILRDGEEIEVPDKWCGSVDNGATRDGRNVVLVYDS